MGEVSVAAVSPFLSPRVTAMATSAATSTTTRPPIQIQDFELDGGGTTRLVVPWDLF